jgi:hypothetical protein
VRNRWSLHLLLLCLLTAGVSLLFLQEPGFGDDLTYWTFGYDLHEVGIKAWGPNSFHDLRWPVWGWCWLLQAIGLQGIAAYSGVAIIYLTAGAAVAFTFGRIISKSLPFAWACGLAFVFCPLLDTLCHRPMPDLSEGVIGGLTLLAWWRLMRAESPRAAVGWAALTGLGVFLCESNRLTGVFIVPVLLVATLWFARRRFLWLVIAGVFAAFFYACEAAFYHSLFQDWLHNLHANMNGKDNKGTGNIPFITSPFRFLDSLWAVGRLSPFYCILALLGLGSIFLRRWSRQQPPEERLASGVSIPGEQLIALWFIVLYLEYACGPQSLFPWKPVIRDASRFLAGLAIPFSILAVLGVRSLFEIPFVRARRWGRWIPEHPFVVGAVALVALVAVTSRPFFDLGFLSDMRAYVQKVPPGTKVFTHHMMRSLAIMSDASAAKRITWMGEQYNAQGQRVASIPREILNANPIYETYAAQADEFWYMHKIVWMNNRKRMEKLDPATKKKTVRTQPPLATYFTDTEKSWALAKLMVKGDSPDLAFYRRRTPGMPVPVPLPPSAPEFGGLLPELPVTWVQSKNRSVHFNWEVPASMRGKVVRLDIRAFSDEVETSGVAFKFDAPASKKRSPLERVLANATEALKIGNSPKAKKEVLVKPYTYPEAGRDFFLIPIPPNAENCHIQIRFSKAVKSATLVDLQAMVITPLEGTAWATDRVESEP